MTAGKTGGLHGAGPKQLVNNNNRPKPNQLSTPKVLKTLEVSTPHLNDTMFSKITFFHYRVWNLKFNKENLFFMLVGPFVVPTHIKVN